MKILIITSEELHPDDSVSSIFELSQARSLQQRGLDVRILSVRNPFSIDEAIRATIKKFMFLGHTNRLSRSLSIRDLFLLLLFGKRGKCVSKNYNIEGVPVIEGFGISQGNADRIYQDWISIGIAIYKNLVRNKKFIPDVIHGHSRFLKAGILASRIKKQHGTPYVITEHSDRYHKGNIDDFEVSLINEMYLNASFILSVSQSLKENIKKFTPPGNQIHVLPNFIDREFDNIVLKNQLNDHTVFLNVASLDDNKNHALLIQSFYASFKNKLNVSLRIVGEGGKKQELARLIQTLGMKNQIQLLGALSRKEVIQEMIRSDVFVLSSKHETFGVVLIEALACGLPLISTKCGGPESIVNEINGMLVDQDVEHLSDALMHMDQNKNQFDRQSLRKSCLEQYGSDVLSQKLIGIYQEALAR